jgi:hypothetical protein
LDDVQFTKERVKEGPYRATGFERWANILLCRGDLAEEDLEARPVSFTDLVGSIRFLSLDFKCINSMF